MKDIKSMAKGFVDVEETEEEERKTEVEREGCWWMSPVSFCC